MNIIYPIIIVVIAYCVLGDGKVLKSLKSEHIVLITLGIWLFTVAMNKQSFINVPTELGDPQDFREGSANQKLLWWRNPASKIIKPESVGEGAKPKANTLGDIWEHIGWGRLTLLGLCVFVFVVLLGVGTNWLYSTGGDNNKARGGVGFLGGFLAAVMGVGATMLYFTAPENTYYRDQEGALKGAPAHVSYTFPTCAEEDVETVMCIKRDPNDEAKCDPLTEGPEQECSSDCFPHKRCLATTPTMNTTALAEFKRNNPEYVDVSSLASKIGQCEDKYPLSALGHTDTGAIDETKTCEKQTTRDSCHKLKIGTCSPNYGTGELAIGFTLDDATTAAVSNNKTHEQSAMVDIHNEITGICETMNHNKNECEMYADRCIPLQPEVATHGWYGGNSTVSCKDQWNSEHICNGITKSSNGDPTRADHRVCRYLDESDSVDAVSLVNLCNYTEPDLTGQATCRGEADDKAATPDCAIAFAAAGDTLEASCPTGCDYASGADTPLSEQEQRCKWNRDGGLFDGDISMDETNIENWKYAYYLPLPTLNNSEVTGLLTQLGVHEESASGWASSIQGDNDIDKKKHLFQYIMDYATHAREVSTDICQQQGRYKCPQPGGCIEGSCPGGGQVQEGGRCQNGDRPQRCGPEDIDVEDPQSGYCVDDCNYCQNHPHNPIGAQDPEFGNDQWNPHPSVCVSTLNSSSGVTPPRIFACSGNTIPTHDVVCQEGTVKGPDSSWKPQGIIPSLAVNPNDTSLTNTCTDPDGGSSCTEHNQDRSTCESNTDSAGALCVFTAVPITYAGIQESCCQ